MSAKFSFGKIELAVAPGRAASTARREDDTPLRVVVVADFSGRASRGLREPLKGRRVWAVDCDNFEQVLRRLEVRLRVSGVELLGNEIPFESIDDFRPDQLLSSFEPLAALARQRPWLLNPATAQEAAAETQKFMTSSAPTNPEAPTAPTQMKSAESDPDMLARLMGGSPQPVAPRPKPTGAGIEGLIRNIVAPSIVPGTTPQQSAALSALDLELTKRLRALLHQPEFQALESAWRGVDLLVRRFGGEDNIRLQLLDISREELAADLASESLETTGFWRLLQHHADDNQAWAICLGLYTFDGTLADVELLGRLAKVCAGAGLAFISSASPRLVGCDSFGAHPDPDDWKQPFPADVREAWQALRELPEATSIALALPRFLLRQPFGKQSEPIDTFPFEELPDGSSHEAYLWGNPAIVCGHVLMQALQSEGWPIEVSGGEVAELPVHKFKRDGEIEIKPCAEAWLSERAGEAIRRQGLTPLFSVKGRDEVRLPQIHSLSGRTLAIR